MRIYDLAKLITSDTVLNVTDNTDAILFSGTKNGLSVEIAQRDVTNIFANDFNQLYVNSESNA